MRAHAHAHTHTHMHTHTHTLPAPRSVCRNRHPGISFWFYTVLYWKLALCLPLSCKEPSGLSPRISFVFLCPSLGAAPSALRGSRAGLSLQRTCETRRSPWTTLRGSAGWTPARPGLRVGPGVVSLADDDMPRVPCQCCREWTLEVPSRLA